MTGNTSPEGNRRKAHNKKTNDLVRAKKEREALISGREVSGSALSRVSQSPVAVDPRDVPQPHAEMPAQIPPVQIEEEGLLLRMTVLATGGSVDRTLKFEAEGGQTLAELCVQAHPALVMAGHPICFKVSCNGQTWSSQTDGHASLASLGIADGAIIRVNAERPEPSLAPSEIAPPPPPPPQQEEELVTPIIPDLLPLSPPTQEQTPIPAMESPPIESPARLTPSQTKPLTRARRDTISLKVEAKEKRGGGPPRFYEWELAPGEKLVTLCKRCNLTEPHVPARNNKYKGFVVTSMHGDVWCTKNHGRLSIRELRLESGDEITVEMDWASLGVVGGGAKKTEKRKKREELPAPQPEMPPDVMESPEEPVMVSNLVPAPSVSRPRTPKQHQQPVVPERVKGKPDPVSVTPTAEYHAKTGIPLPPVISTDRSQSPRRDPLSPSPVVIVPNPVPPPPVPFEASTMSPSRGVVAPLVGAALSPRMSKGVPEDLAWISFTDALSAVLHEQDLLLVSAETVRDLIRHYGFDKDPITAAKIELHWKRLSGRAPMEAAGPRSPGVASPTRDPRHVKHIETVFPEGRKPQCYGLSDEAAKRHSRGQQRRQKIADQEEVRSQRPFTSLPFGGGTGETPMQGPIGRKLEQEPSIGRRRAVSPSSTAVQHADRRQQHQHDQKSISCNPNAICEGQNTDDSFHMYSKELRSIEYSENKHKQALVAPGKKTQLRNKMEAGSHDGLANIGGNTPKQNAGKARVQYKEDSGAGCDPNPMRGEDSMKRGRNFRCAPDQPPANSNPNGAGHGSGSMQNHSIKCYSVGPEKTVGGCNPNSAGQTETGPSPHERKGGLISYRASEPAATCNPNNYNQEGDRRHREAERVTRVEGDKYFKNENRASANCNPNNIGEREPYCKMSKKGTAEYTKVDSGKGCNPNSLTANGSSDVHLQGPAGSAGVFSPGLSVTGKRGGHLVAAATSNPNDTLSAPAAHMVSQTPAQQVSGIPSASRKQAFNHAANDGQSPRAGGRRRAPQHPATLDNNVGSMLM